jgi:CRP-like cAMP-binding protein
MAKVTPEDPAKAAVIWHALEPDRALNHSLVTVHEKPWYIVHPRAKLKLVWDFFCLMLLVYCVIDVPFTLAFVGQDLSFSNATTVKVEADDTGLTNYGIWSFTLDMLFLVDTFLNFFTAIFVKTPSLGVQDDVESSDVLDVNIAHIFKAYVTSWFFPDLVSSLPLDTILINIDIADTKSLLRIPRVLKIFRAIRLVKLLRLRRSSAYLASISHLIELNPGIIRIVKYFIVFLVLAHYLSCAMFFIGTLDSLDAYGNQISWLTQTNVVNSDGIEQQLALAPLGEQYLWALYWTVTTMTTVGFGDIRPSTEAEVIMSIIIMIIGGGVFSFIVGNTANLLTRLDSQGQEFEDLSERVSDFMHVNKIPQSLRDQCMRWIKFKHENSFQIPKALAHCLSDTLRAELYVFVNRGFLERTGVLRRHLSSSNKVHATAGTADHAEAAAVMQAAEVDGRNQDDRFLGMLMEHCRELHFSPSEIIFIQGCKGMDMYFIEQGQVDITRQRADGSSSCVLTTLYTGAVFGEESLVSKEHERRSYTARSRTWLKLKVIDTQQVKDIASLFPRLKADFTQDLEKFAKSFQSSLEISMSLDEKIGQNIAQYQGNVLHPDTVRDILAASHLVKKWKDPESVRASVSIFPLWHFTTISIFFFYGTLSLIFSLFLDFAGVLGRPWRST